MDKLGHAMNATKHATKPLDRREPPTAPTDTRSTSKGQPQLRSEQETHQSLIRQDFMRRTFEARGSCRTALNAITKGDLPHFKSSLASGELNINCARFYGLTALTLAATENRQEMVEELLNRGAQVDNSNVFGRTALMMAARRGNVSMMKRLISHGADINHQDGAGLTALHCAVRSGNVEAVRALIGSGADINIADVNGDTPFALALEGSEAHADVIGELIQAGADLNRVDSEGKTLLIVAVRNGHAKRVKCLVTLGADLNATDKEGNTALIWASRNNKASLVDALMKGSEPLGKNHRNAQGDTALTVAVKGGCSEAVKALLDRGVDINVPDAAGNTPLICAASDEYGPSIAELLLRSKQKPDLTKRNNEGKTALEIAASEWDGVSFAALLAHYIPEDMIGELRRNGRMIDIKWGLASMGTEKMLAAFEEREKSRRRLNQSELAGEANIELIARRERSS